MNKSDLKDYAEKQRHCTPW